MVTHEDIQELKKVFDDRYVMQTECEATQKTLNNKLSNDDKRIELLIQRQALNNWLTGAIAGGIVALVIKVFMGG